MKTRIHILLVAAALMALPALTQAQAPAFTGHYVPGVEGIKGATLPPPGFYIRNYSVFYNSTRLNDADGNRAPVDFEVMVFANLIRPVFITDWKLLGGNVGMDAILPIVYTELTLPGATKTSNLGIGDIFFEPITISWHERTYSAAVGYGFFAPTGRSQPGTARPGKGFWTHMLTAGATFHLGADRSWSASFLNRYELHTREDDTRIRPGEVWTVEYGLSKALNRTLEAGLIGYYQMQTTDDSGPGASPNRDKVFAAGPEISMFSRSLMLFASLRYAYEFIAEDRPQGHTGVITLTKPF